MKYNPRFRYYVQYDGSMNPIPGTLTRRMRKPSGNWRDVTDCLLVCCTTTTSTTTTSTSSTTTTTTTL